MDMVAPTAATACHEEASAMHLFVYGSLRSDTDFPTRYSKRFVEGCIVTKATLPGARLYLDGYPAARFEEGGEGVVGELLTHPNMTAKVKEADRIELEGELYKRTVVNVVTDSGDEVPAYAYIRQDCDTHIPIPCGDWLKRDKLAIAFKLFSKEQPDIEEEVARRALERSQYDVRLALSFVKWGIA